MSKSPLRTPSLDACCPVVSVPGNSGNRCQAMTVGVTSGEIQPVRSPLGQGRLQAVVVRMGSILLFVNYLEIGEIWC